MLPAIMPPSAPPNTRMDDAKAFFACPTVELRSVAGDSCLGSLWSSLTYIVVHVCHDGRYIRLRCCHSKAQSDVPADRIIQVSSPGQDSQHTVSKHQQYLHSQTDDCDSCVEGQ